jgi:hypothetical protein
MVVYTCNPSTGETEAGGSWVAANLKEIGVNFSLNRINK